MNTNPLKNAFPYVALFICLASLCTPSSKAAVVININEVGGDVVATSSGTINTTGFDSQSGLTTSTGFIRGTSFNPNWFCAVGTGTSAGEVGAYLISNFTNDNNDICTTSAGAMASLNSGDFVGLVSRSAGEGADVVYVPVGYASGDPLSGSSMWAGASFASLELNPGTYVYTWGTGETADSLTLNIGDVLIPPEPSAPIPTVSTSALMLMTLLFGWTVFINRRRLF